MPKTDLQNDHNVYILGAGYSADRGLPVISRFLNCMRDCRSQLTDGEARDAIDAVLNYRQSAAAASDRVVIDIESIEDLFSLAEMTGDQATLDSIPLAIGATLNHARLSEPHPTLWIEPRSDSARYPAEWNNSAEPDGERTRLKVPAYEVYLATMLGLMGNRSPHAKDTILTFNYDLVVEESAASIGAKVWYGLPAEHLRLLDSAREFVATDATGAVPLLKLHGSVNWAAETPRVIHRDYESLRKSGGRPMLIPPTWKKLAETAVWAEAIRALSTATRIAVIGYSMPLSDGHFKYLLAAGLKDNVSLRKLEFVGYAPRYDPDADATEPFVQRAQSLIRGHHWDHGRASCFLGGTREFFLSRLRSRTWNREWGPHLSFLNRSG